MSLNAEDQFQFWLMDMDDAIEWLVQSLPAHLGERLNLSPDSLSVIEGFILENFPTISDIKEPTEARVVDGLARYVGEVFRTHLGGKWGIELTDKKNAFYGLPQLLGMAGQRTQICPLTLVTASTDRRTGRFIRSVFDSCQEDASKA